MSKNKQQPEQDKWSPEKGPKKDWLDKDSEFYKKPIPGGTPTDKIKAILNNVRDQVVKDTSQPDFGLLNKDAVDYLKYMFRSTTGLYDGLLAKAHAEDHVKNQRKNKDILNDVIQQNDNRTVHGTFPTEQVQWTAMYKLLDRNQNQITSLYDGYNHGKKATIRDDKLSIIYPERPNEKGYMLPDGFAKTKDGFYHYYVSEKCASAVIVFDKETKDLPNDILGKSKIPIIIQSIYPGYAPDYSNMTEHERKKASSADLQSRYINLRNIDISNLMRRTDTFRKASPIEKTQLLFAANPENSKIPTNDPNDKYTPSGKGFGRYIPNAGNVRVSNTRISDAGLEIFEITKINKDHVFKCTIRENGSISVTKNPIINNKLDKNTLLPIKDNKKILNFNKKEDKDCLASVEPEFTKMIEKVKTTLNDASNQQKSKQQQKSTPSENKKTEHDYI